MSTYSTLVNKFKSLQRENEWGSQYTRETFNEFLDILKWDYNEEDVALFITSDKEENNNSNQCDLTAEIMFEDARYPQLILRGDFGTHGYWVNNNTGEISKFCTCSAWSKNECICGCWDDEEEDDDYNE